MNKHQIGTNAGIVWRLLNNNKSWNYCELKKASGLSDKDLNAAIGGWPAKTKLISVTNKQRKTVIF